MDTNPLRTFDSKHEGTQAVLAEAPRITSFLSEEASAHLAAVSEGLGRSASLTRSTTVSCAASTTTR